MARPLTLLAALATLLLAPAALATPTPAELANRMAEALKGAESLRCSVIVHPGEELRGANLELRAEVVAKIDSEKGFRRVRADSRVSGENLPRGARLLYVRSGDEAHVVDYIKNTVVRGPAEAVADHETGTLATGAIAWLGMLHDGERWADFGEPTGNTASVRADVREGRELCDVLVLHTRDGDIEMFLSQRTGLPVRIVVPSATGVETHRIDRLRTDVPMADSMFQLQTTPRGFDVEDLGAERTGEPAPREPAGATDRKVGLDVGDLAPDWTLEDPEGARHSLSDYRGKVVVMDFWATWCGPCKRVMPGLQRLHKELEGEGLAILGINTWERSPDMAEGFMRSNGYTYQLLLGGDAVASRYRVQGIPTFYVVGTEGEIVFTGRGYSADMERRLEHAIRQAIGDAATRRDLEDLDNFER